jgi:hypothetical protein
VPPISYSAPSTLAFVVIPVVLVLALAAGIDGASRHLGEGARARRRAVTVVLGGTVWMAIWWFVASSGVMRQWDGTPPPFAALVAGVLGVSLLVACGPYGRRLALGIPLWVLIAIQGFRLPLELAMHALYEAGIMPGQMSYSGRNFDILTGATALIVAPIVRGGRARALAALWNVMGLALLVNIVAVSILSTPRFAYFGPDRLNVFVTYPPFVWLPTVMVAAALAGHLLVARALLSPRDDHASA